MSKTITDSPTFPYFSLKHKIMGAEFQVIPNNKQKYKVIYRLNILVEYGIDFIKIKKKVMWHRIGVPLCKVAHKSHALDKSKIMDNISTQIWTKSPPKGIYLDNHFECHKSQESQA